MRPVLLLLAACCKSSGTPPAIPVQAVGEASPHVPSVLNVSVDGPTGEAFVEYGDGDFSLATPRDASASHHELAVLGLKAGRTYDWRAVVVDAAGARHESDAGTFTVPAPPERLFPLTISVDDPSAEVRFVAGNVVRTNDGVSFAAILDRDGDWVWWVNSGGDLITSPKLSLDGRSLLWNEYDFRQQQVVGTIVRVSLDGRTRTETAVPFSHHDFLEHEDGSLAYFAMTFADFTFGAETVTLASDEIRVVPEGGSAPSTVFSMFDDFPLEPVLTCDHMKPSSGPDELFGTSAYEWTHSNSLMYLPETDSYYVLQKYTDRLIAIARATGDVDWTMSGLDGEFALPNGDDPWLTPSGTDLWSHGHMSEIWPGGGLVFDNGDHHAPDTSRALEFAYDEAAKTVEIVWELAHPGGEHTAVMGDVRRLPNDHRLVTWSELGSLTEVTTAGEIVWEAEWEAGSQPLDAILGRIVPITDLYDPLAGDR